MSELVRNHKATREYFVRERECRYCKRHMTKEFTEELWIKNQMARSEAAKQTIEAKRKAKAYVAKKRAIEVNRGEIVRMWKQGKSCLEICTKFNVSQSTVFRVVKSYKEVQEEVKTLTTLPMGQRL